MPIIETKKTEYFVDRPEGNLNISKTVGTSYSIIRDGIETSHELAVKDGLTVVPTISYTCKESATNKKIILKYRGISKEYTYNCPCSFTEHIQVGSPTRLTIMPGERYSDVSSNWYGYISYDASCNNTNKQYKLSINNIGNGLSWETVYLASDKMFSFRARLNDNQDTTNYNEYDAIVSTEWGKDMGTIITVQKMGDWKHEILVSYLRESNGFGQHKNYGSSITWPSHFYSYYNPKYYSYYVEIESSYANGFGSTYSYTWTPTTWGNDYLKITETTLQASMSKGSFSFTNGRIIPNVPVSMVSAANKLYSSTFKFEYVPLNIIKTFTIYDNISATYSGTIQDIKINVNADPNIKDGNLSNSDAGAGRFISILDDIESIKIINSSSEKTSDTYKYNCSLQVKENSLISVRVLLSLKVNNTRVDNIKLTPLVNVANSRYITYESAEAPESTLADLSSGTLSANKGDTIIGGAIFKFRPSKSDFVLNCIFNLSSGRLSISPSNTEVVIHFYVSNGSATNFIYDLYTGTSTNQLTKINTTQELNALLDVVSTGGTYTEYQAKIDLQYNQSLIGKNYVKILMKNFNFSTTKYPPVINEEGISDTNFYNPNQTIGGHWFTFRPTHNNGVIGVYVVV